MTTLLRKQDVKHLLTYELSSTLFCLTKDGYLRKSKKSQLATELMKPLKEKYLAEIPPTEEERVTFIDFMGYARKVPVTKLKLKTFHDLVKNLGSTFRPLSATCTSIDIVFDLYKEKSVKSHERHRRSDGKCNVSTPDQSLPVEMKKFWDLSDNKVSFQQIFIKWIKESQIDHSWVFLVGSHCENETMWIGIVNESCYVEQLLQCSHEEANDRIMFHLNHVVKISNFCSAVIASTEAKQPCKNTSSC